MITERSSLADVCYVVAAALEQHGISGVLTGGSAASLYAPQAYMSDDADFILEEENSLAEVAIALESTGFRRESRSRSFFHPKSQYSVEFPKGPLAVASDYITETHEIKRGRQRVRVLTRFDCIRDRLAHFYFWNDYTALNAAVAVASQDITANDLANLRVWTERESVTLLPKLDEFENRLEVSKRGR